MPCKCVSRACPFFDEDVWADWVMLTPDLGDPPLSLDIGDDDTDPYGFAIGPSAKYRDFCSSCHVPVEFNRARGSLPNEFFAFCPQCGQPNVWS
jgi:hypothetical protein